MLNAVVEFRKPLGACQCSASQGTPKALHKRDETLNLSTSAVQLRLGEEHSNPRAMRRRISAPVHRALLYPEMRTASALL